MTVMTAILSTLSKYVKVLKTSRMLCL